MNPVEDLVNEVVRPLGNTLINCIQHPIDTARDLALSAVSLVDNHPYMAVGGALLVGYGLYKGNIKIQNNRLQVNFNTPVLGYSGSLRLGSR